MSFVLPAIEVQADVGVHQVVVHTNGVGCVRVLGDLTREDIIACHAVIGQYVELATLPLLIDLTQLQYLQAEAIDQVRSSRHFCVALFGGGFAQRALSTVVGQVYGAEPNQPTRFFIDEGAAREWIEELREGAGETFVPRAPQWM